MTFSTFRRQAFFPGRMTARWYQEMIACARETCPFYLFAYVIMPEHVHLVLQPLPGVTMRRILWHLKKPMTDKVIECVKTHQPSFLTRLADRRPSGNIVHRFWMRGGGYDRNLRSSNDVHEKIGYVHGNPVRRGLVECPEEWPYSSASDWILDKPGPVPIDWNHIPDPELRR
ncbi:MAG: transposase [Phycisphaerae bacterium]|nr:transposase [Phycisphaerae bacterium]